MNSNARAHALPTQNAQTKQTITKHTPTPTNQNQVRAKAATLLGELLHRLPALPLTEGSVRHYADFFAARLGDFPSLPGALLALRALLQHHGAAARQVCSDRLILLVWRRGGRYMMVMMMYVCITRHIPTPTNTKPQETPTIARALFKDVHVPSTTQNVRQKAFEVLLELVSPSSVSSGVDEANEAEQVLLRPLLEMGEEFLRCARFACLAPPSPLSGSYLHTTSRA